LPHHKSAIKRIRQDKRRRTRNRMVKSRVKTAVKALESSATADDARGNLVTAVSALDKAVKKGILHRRTAARKKSRLARKVNDIQG
jgi:small subunit ribosomal protein S20